MRPSRSPSLARRLEMRLWTGPAGHLVGGALDLLVALVCHRVARARRRLGR